MSVIWGPAAKAMLIAAVIGGGDANGQDEKSKDALEASWYQSPFAKRGIIGLASVSDDNCKVHWVLSGGPADLAGVKPGDVITRVEDNKITTFKSFQHEISTRTAGDEIEIEVMRDGKPLVLNAELSSWHRLRKLLRHKRPIINASIVSRGGVIDFTGPINLKSPMIQLSRKSILALNFEDHSPTWIYHQGNISLNGTLRLKFTGLKLAAGQSFEIITVTGSLTGQFKNLELPELPKGLEWQIVYDNQESKKDFDGDGELDVTLLVTEVEK